MKKLSIAAAGAAIIALKTATASDNECARRSTMENVDETLREVKVRLALLNELASHSRFCQSRRCFGAESSTRLFKYFTYRSSAVLVQFGRSNAPD